MAVQSRLYFKVLQVKCLKWRISDPEDCFILVNSAEPNKILPNAILDSTEVRKRGLLT